MSLSDYSSDDSFEAEDSQISHKAVRGLQNAKMNAKGTRGSDAGFSSMFLGAMAALAVAGVAAGTLYMRQHLPGRRSAIADNADEGNDKRRKDLRRKRGEVKESPRGQPFMARTESASSVGPLRKHPRRDTSEESGGEASGSSPTARSGRTKALRKTASKNRHRRPPLRAPAFEAQKETPEGEETAEDTEEVNAPEGDAQIEAAGAEQEGSRAAPMPIGVDTPGHGVAGEAAERTAAADAAGTHQDDVKQQPTAEASSPTAESAEVRAPPTEPVPSDAEPAPSPAAAEGRQEAAPREPAPRDAEGKGLPDLLSESYSASAATQPSLDTFTADCDVLDQAVDVVNADAKAAAEGQVDKGPEEAPFKDEGSFKGGIKDHSSHHDAKEVQRPRKVADIPAEGQTADTQRDADATEKEPEGKEQISAATRDEQEPEEAAAVGIPATESEPSGRGGAAATDKGAGVKSAQAQGAVSKEVHPQAAPSHTTAAEGDASVSKPDGDKAKREEPAEQRLPVTGATEGSTKSAESASGTESGASKDEATGKKQVAMSDEQTAILERGDSMLAEADEGDPKGIQLIRRMQAEVDKQDDMPDFSKTDAYRSSQTRQSEDQASAATQQKPSPAGTRDEKGKEAAGPDQHQEAEGAIRASGESKQVPAKMETEPSLQLLADTTPGGEELDLSSAEVDTVAKITSEEPEQAEGQGKDAKEGQPAAEKKPQHKEAPHRDAASCQAGEGAAKRHTQSEKPSQDTHQEDDTSTEQPDVETPPERTLHDPKSQGGDAAIEAEQLEAPVSDQKHARKQPEPTPTKDQTHAQEQMEEAPKVNQSHAEGQPKEAPTSDESHAKKQPESARTIDHGHAEEQPKSKAVTAELPVQKDAAKAKPEPADTPSTSGQAPGSSQPEQGIPAGAARGTKPNGVLRTLTKDEQPHDKEQAEPVHADAAGAPEEAPQHSASALAAAAAAAAAALATEDRDELISSQPSVGTIESSKPAVSGNSFAGTTESSQPAVTGSAPAPKEATEGLKEEAEKPEAAAAKAPYDPLGMDAPDDASGPAEVVPGEEAGTEASEDVAMPRNNTERDVQLNLAVALRMVEERGNVAAAERTLQKQLAAVRESKETIRPDFMQRLVGTLADVIARAAHQEAAAGKHSPTHPDRMPEIIGLLQTAFESAKAAGDASRSREGWRLGNALLQADRLDEAEALFKEEVKYSQDQLGAQNANTQQTRAYLAEVLAKKGNKAEAYKLLSEASEQLEQQAKELSTSKGGDSKPEGAAESEEAYSGLTPQAAATMSAAKCSVKLATMQDEDKDFKDAEVSARRAVRLMEAAFGKDNPRNSTAYGTLAAILKHAGGEQELREAIVLYTQLQRTMEDIHGLRNAQSALALRSIADVHLMLREYGEAVQCLEKARQIAASVHGRDHPILESFWEALAEAKREAGDKQGAKEASRQALLIKSHAHRPGGGQRSPRETGAARRGRGRSRR